MFEESGKFTEQEIVQPNAGKVGVQGGAGPTLALGLRVRILNFVLVSSGKTGKLFSGRNDIRFVFFKSGSGCCGRIELEEAKVMRSQLEGPLEPSRSHRSGLREGPGNADGRH